MHFVRLCDDVVIFFIRRQVNIVFRDFAVFFNKTVRRFNKAVFVDFGIRCQVGDQTDVRTFRRFNRTDSAVMAVVNVTDFEAGALTR